MATGKQRAIHTPLSSSEKAQALDGEAGAWGLAASELVKAAGESCAGQFVKYCTQFYGGANGHSHKLPKIVLLAGAGNNAADGLVMIQALLAQGIAALQKITVLTTKPLPEGKAPAKEKTVFEKTIHSIQLLNVPVMEWEPRYVKLLKQADIVIDGITGSGLKSPLKGKALEMVNAVMDLRQKENAPLVVSIDVPSGLFDGWQPQMPIIQADVTLAIEPQKICLYYPAARPMAGDIVPVRGIFPCALLEKYREASLLNWKNCAAAIPPISADAYKYTRGLVEIWAGSPGAAGAAMLAARAAQSAGAGLVRLIVDPSLYPVLAPGSGGVMVVPDSEHGKDLHGDPKPRFAPDALLLGPGWGRGIDRAKLLEQFLPMEKNGIPLILDADAIALARNIRFNGNAIITPHPGEFAEYTGLPKEQILAEPLPLLQRYAKKNNVHILLKGHVLFIVSPSGETGVIDGMIPALAAGGTGDVLAGFCAAIAGRVYHNRSLQRSNSRRRNLQRSAFDGFSCAAAAATLLMEAGRALAGTFFDPGELAHAAAGIAGRAWLPQKGEFYE